MRLIVWVVAMLCVPLWTVCVVCSVECVFVAALYSVYNCGGLYCTSMWICGCIDAALQITAVYTQTGAKLPQSANGERDSNSKATFAREPVCSL